MLSKNTIWDGGSTASLLLYYSRIVPPGFKRRRHTVRMRSKPNSDSECDIREHFDTNECPNIFVSTKLHEWISEYIHTNFFDTNECPNKYSYWKLHEYSNIFEYSSRFYTLTHSPTNVRIYSYKQIWHEWMSEYIRKRKIDMNECPNIYSWPIYSNIRIFEYIRHTLFCFNEHVKNDRPGDDGTLRSV